jgi:tetratricopeptide (TPR) repeat protein
MPPDRVTPLAQIHAALLKAYPDEHSLRLAVNQHLGLDLDTITRPSPLPSRISALLRWAESQGRVPELITSVLNDLPANPDIGRLLELRDRGRGAAAAIRTQTGRLPATGRYLFGRDTELAALDAAAVDGTAIVVVVAFGGTGKSTLVSHWLRRLQRDGYRDFSRIYAWSFLNQGLAGDSASADLFIDTSLKWFGERDPVEATGLERGFGLAERIREERTLLILDGLEALQYSRGHRKGQLRDEKMYGFLRALAEQNPGLCVITTRTWPEDLSEFEGISVKRLPLQQLSVAAGIETLRAHGVNGEDDELGNLVRMTGGNAFYLRSLGTYVRSRGGEIHSWNEGASGEDREPLHEVMRGYAEWFSGGPELATLYLVSLFEGSCTMDLLEKIRAAPTIAGLTESLQPLSVARWRGVIIPLQEPGPGLILGDPQKELEPHPLVREYFAERLRTENWNAWREAHGRLYEHFKQSTDEFPETLERMWPLFLAVRHASHAGRYREALNDVYWRRISRGVEKFHMQQLGALDAALACLTHFFASRWKTPIAAFSDGDERFLLAEATFILEGLGRLSDALEPAEQGLRLAIDQQDLLSTAIWHYNVGGLCRMMGDLDKAHENARAGGKIAAVMNDLRWRVIALASEAVVRHQMGGIDDAQRLFKAAEDVETNLPSESLVGNHVLRYWLFDLLLDRGAWDEVIARALASLERGTSVEPPLAAALDRLALARAYLDRARANGNANLEEAGAVFELALDGILRSRRGTYLAPALRARGELSLAANDTGMAEADFRRALALATRSRLRLEEADCHLALCRLELARDALPAARASLEEAAAIVADCGYHRRDGEIRALRDRGQI